MISKKITFKNSSGIRLVARLELPENEPKAFALFAHCFTCNKNLTAVRTIGRTLTEKNIAVLRFDFTGLGESEGDFENTNFINIAINGETQVGEGWIGSLTLTTNFSFKN
jgi:putative redox protein